MIIQNSKFKIQNRKQGFTLIELLIVIAIIGVLATLLMANFVGVRQRARDAQRKSDIRQIQSALEIYRSDIGNYPATLPGCNTTPLKNTTTDGTVTVYMQKIPCDPNGTSVSYAYSIPAAGGYKLVACLENASDSQKDATRASGCSSASFTVTNP